MSLIQIYDSLATPAKNKQAYSAQFIGRQKTYRIAKSQNALPALLIKTSFEDAYSGRNISLRNISIVHQIDCRIENSNLKQKTDKFSIIQCNSEERHIHECFFDVIDLLTKSCGPEPSEKAVDDFMFKILEIFKRIYEPPIKTVQGLWAELLIISNSKNSERMLESWHFDDRDKYDFSDHNERVEVKSYASSYRVHSFSIEQLNPPYGSELLVASVNTLRSHKGVNISNLQNRIENNVQGNIRLVEILRLKIISALGNEYKESIKIGFDEKIACNSLKYYRCADIPKLNIEQVPKGVFDVKFKIDLSTVSAVKLRKSNKQKLFSALPSNVS